MASAAIMRESVARSNNGATFFFNLGMVLLHRFVTEMMHDECSLTMGHFLPCNQVQVLPG